MRERDVERYLIKRVKDAGGISYKWSSPGQRGVPDRIVFMKKFIYFVEVKGPAGRLSKLQAHVRDQILDHGGNWSVLYGKHGVDAFMENKT